MNTTGGFTISIGAVKAVSSGGSLTVTDLSMDLVNKKVYATLIGANGVGTLNHFELWNAANVSFNDTPGGWVTGSGPIATLSGLSITSTGFNTMVQSLGLLNLGRSALMGITDYGSIVVGVPEPGTYALMGLGLLGIGLATRRGRQVVH